MKYPELTPATRAWFEEEYQRIFSCIDAHSESLERAREQGNTAREKRIASRILSLMDSTRELDRVLLGVFHAERRYHPDEFFPEIDRYDITPIQEPEHESVPSDEQLANSWQDDLIYSYRSER